MNEEELKEMYKELKRNKKIIENIDTDFFFEFAETVLNLLEKKDKIIDLMSEEIAKTDDDLCEHIDQTTKNNNCRAEEDCINCIKQYFKEKVENGE